MKYRDQLRYIKNHQNESERKRPRRRGGRKERKRAKRKSAFGRLLWTVQMAASLFFVAAMAILGILPRQYLAGLALFRTGEKEQEATRVREGLVCYAERAPDCWRDLWVKSKRGA